MAGSENDRRIDYIEMGVVDIERSKAFYGNAFGWTFKDYGPEYCEFSDGRLTGGFTTGTEPKPASQAVNDSISSIPTATSWRSGPSPRNSPQRTKCPMCLVASRKLRPDNRSR